ncbi:MULTISPECIES: response regulator transcription factor [Actinomadura]|uniref:DNA-binding response regulator, OmpR family, contains REC and winged-helix (WHTH) domain n=1 Tax=Actinomadura madurae TaxID=1993 RepID=A0A1I5VFE5_9ACTN|nr:response regulator transcription factor [Actinomadura madurae]SFQ06102.1 DNA-binding response regulator, OmpR family, contains REC and winged-helix (wHTH) domain [Actinomadura madurae]SPT60589.1 Response regulator ArlR [Actinomadura madurae]
MNRILISENDERIARFIHKGLRTHGFHPTVVADGDTALRHALSGEYDLLVLTIGLPGRDGFDVLRRIRAARATLPVIILTSRTTVGDTVAGLDGGADDYMTKPFRFDELLARIRLRLRTAHGAVAAPTALSVDGLTLDLRTRRARTPAGHTVDLSAREFALLDLLLRHPRQVVSQEQILDHVWGPDVGPCSNVVAVYIGRLRRKLGPGVIETLRGMGYRCG